MILFLKSRRVVPMNEMNLYEMFSNLGYHCLDRGGSVFVYLCENYYLTAIKDSPATMRIYSRSSDGNYTELENEGIKNMAIAREVFIFEDVEGTAYTFDNLNDCARVYNHLLNTKFSDWGYNKEFRYGYMMDLHSRMFLTFDTIEDMLKCLKLYREKYETILEEIHELDAFDIFAYEIEVLGRLE